MVPKGYTLFEENHRYLLVDGPRKSAKTLSILNKLCRHAWENSAACIAIVTKTTKNAKAGVWSDLTKFIIPHWEEPNFGFRYTVEPKMAVDTKMSYCRVRNRFGMESEFQIHPLERAADAEERFKGTRFSMVYLSEADHFEDRIVFDILSDQLRVIGIPYENHQLIADCNPPEDGEDHWLHDVFFKVHHGEQYPQHFKNLFFRIPFTISDNTLLPENERIELETKYSHDQNLHDRYVKGLWVKDKAIGHFSDHYAPSIHVIGDTSSRREDEWEVIVPGDKTTELFSGWDLGDVNHAAVIAAKRDLGEDSAWDVIDEIVLLERNISIADFTEMFVERMDYWESYMKQHTKKDIMWRHWSDSSAMAYRSASDSNDQLIVRQHSLGRISLIGFQKTAGSVKRRIGLVKKLLFERRLFVSAQCIETQRMLENLRPGKNKGELIKDGSREKHVFDALTYMLLSESPMDVEMRTASTVKPKVVFANA